MRLIFLAVLMAVFTAAPAFADDKSSKKAVINSVQISGTSIYIYGNKLLKNSKDKVFFATESSSEMMEVPFMEGGDDFIEVMLPYEPSAGTYRLGVGKSPKNLRVSELLSFGSIGADGRDGVDGADGADGNPGVDGRDGIDGADGLNGVNGSDGIDGINGVDGVNGQNGLDGSSCSANQDGSSVVISCVDGTTAVLASEGTVVVTPDIIIEPSDISTINTGEIVVVDDNNNLLGAIAESYGPTVGNIVEIAPTVEGKDLVSMSNTSLGEIFIGAYFLGNYNTLFFTEAECQGNALVLNGYQDVVMFTGDYRDPTRQYFLSGNIQLEGTVLSKSNYVSQRFFSGEVISSATPCTNQDNALSSPWVAEKFSLSDELLNAGYPLRLEQLP